MRYGSTLSVGRLDAGSIIGEDGGLLSFALTHAQKWLPLLAVAAAASAVHGAAGANPKVTVVYSGTFDWTWTSGPIRAAGAVAQETKVFKLNWKVSGSGSTEGPAEWTVHSITGSIVDSGIGGDGKAFGCTAKIDAVAEPAQGGISLAGGSWAVEPPSGIPFGSAPLKQTSAHGNANACLNAAIAPSRYMEGAALKEWRTASQPELTSPARPGTYSKTLKFSYHCKNEDGCAAEPYGSGKQATGTGEQKIRLVSDLTSQVS